MARRPDIGYFEDDLDLLDSQTWDHAYGDFGEAQTINPLVYKSLSFAYLEDEAIWTRDWICIGTVDDIPNEGDILPYTVGNHGIHVQRMSDGGLEGRFNNAQHGGCRFVPVQCQNGTKTKCSFTSCGYSRDRDAISAAEGAQPVPAMHQYTGLRPERLIQISVTTVQGLILVNIDRPDHTITLEPALEDQINSAFENHPVRIEKEWSEFQCNWKLLAEVLLQELNVVPNKEQAFQGNSFIGLMEIARGSQSPLSGVVVWSFPNMILVKTDMVSCWVALQQTALEKVICRVQFYGNVECEETYENLATLKNILKTIGADAETLQTELNPNALPMVQDALTAHWSQKVLIDRLLKMPRNEVTAPIFQQVQHYLI